jgi:hypothetical protein
MCQRSGGEQERDDSWYFHGKAGYKSFQVDGEFKSRIEPTAMAFSPLPEGRPPGHAPPPPRPLGRFGGIVSGRCRPLSIEDLEVPIHRGGRAYLMS